MANILLKIHIKKINSYIHSSLEIDIAILFMHIKSPRNTLGLNHKHKTLNCF